MLQSPQAETGAADGAMGDVGNKRITRSIAQALADTVKRSSDEDCHRVIASGKISLTKADMP